MKFTAFISLIILFGHSAFGQSVEFRGEFRSLEDGSPIVYAKVTKKDGTGRFTNIDGMVEMTVSQNEKLIISHLNYDTLVITPAAFKGQDRTTFYLTPRVYRISKVTLTALGPRHFFDNKFVKGDLGKADEEELREKLEINTMRKELKGLDRSAQGGAVLGSPITAIYEKYSKAGKEKRKYYMLLNKHRSDSIALSKFDNKVVRSLTNYDESKTEDFLEFCSFSKSYITKAQTLDLYLEVLYCKKQYELQESEEKQD